MEKMEFTESKIDELKALLESHGVDTSTWGQGATKTIEHLQKEIEDGETTLEIDSDGNLIRKVSLACVNVYYKSEDGKILFLVEEKQVFKNGGERKRTLKSSVTEKMKRGENSTDAATRGVFEELGIEGEINLKKIDKVSDEEEIVSAYPNLKSKREKDIFETYITESQFRPEGYQEVQDDKTTYFVWKELEL